MSSPGNVIWEIRSRGESDQGPEKTRRPLPPPPHYKYIFCKLCILCMFHSYLLLQDRVTHLELKFIMNVYGIVKLFVITRTSGTLVDNEYINVRCICIMQ
jgi:hypothetical protein